jgi:general secretion pathway protein K
MRPELPKLLEFGANSRIGSRRSNSFGSAPPRRRGFALVVVIWGLGVIALLVTPFMSTARLRLQAAFNISAATKADLIAQSAIDLAALSLLAEQNGALFSTHGRSGGGRANFAALQGAGAAAPSRSPHDGRPRSCAFEGAAVIIAIEDEAGKVDLNAAPAKLLKAMLTGLGAAPSQADYVANAIVAFRSNATGDIAQINPEYADSGRPYGPKHASFQTIFELDQVVGVDAALFRQLLPFVTVHSRHPGVDSQNAPPALFAALTGASFDDVRTLAAAPFPNDLDRSDPRFPAPFKQDGEGAVFLVHVETLLATGQTAIREEIVDMNFAAAADSVSQASASPFAVRERRRGSARFIEQLRQAASAGRVDLPPC